MPSFVVNAVIMFILRQVAKWGEATNWELVKADLRARLAPMLPDWSESMIFELADKALDIIAAVLTATTDLKKIADLLVAGKVGEALGALRDLILSVINPSALHKRLANACDDLATEYNQAAA